MSLKVNGYISLTYMYISFTTLNITYQLIQFAQQFPLHILKVLMEHCLHLSFYVYLVYILL